MSILILCCSSSSGQSLIHPLLHTPQTAFVVLLGTIANYGWLVTNLMA
jgi:hypothetical protein